MLYVCRVAGDLRINDLNLELTHMEIIDLTTEDFKKSPRLREATRNGEIARYNPALHKNAVKIKKRNFAQNTGHSSSEVSLSKVEKSFNKSLENIVSRMDSISNKINILFSRNDDSVSKFEGLVEKFIMNLEKEVQINYENPKLDALLEKMDKIISMGGIASYNIKNSSSIKDNFNDPVYVPKIEIGDITKSKIIPKEEYSEGTDNIIEKLKNLKKDKE